MLAIAELGIGTAIVYHLYRPINEKDIHKTQSLIKFYRTCYRAVATVVLLISLAVMPFLPAIVGNSAISSSIHGIFLLFVANTIFSYLLTYKRSMLYADQKNYIINIVHTVAVVALSAAQVLILIKTHNYYLFLTLRIVATILENVIINYIVNKRYEYLRQLRDASPIDMVIKKDIFKKVKGLLYHKASEFAVLGSDSIVISMFLGVATLGLYSNYLLITATFNGIMSQITSAITASVGNLLLEKNQAKHEAVFKKVYFANFWISTVVAVGFFVAVNSFIVLWLGDGYLFSLEIVAALTATLYLTMLRMPIQTFKTAAGIFHEDRYMPIVESVINLVLSLVLVQFVGLIGVFIGTICSTLFLHGYSYPKYTYTRLFGKSWVSYWKMIAGSTAITALIAGLAYAISSLVELENPLASFLVSAFIAAIVSNAVLLILYRKSENMGYFKELTTKMVVRMRRM